MLGKLKLCCCASSEGRKKPSEKTVEAAAGTAGQEVEDILPVAAAEADAQGNAESRMIVKTRDAESSEDELAHSTNSEEEIDVAYLLQAMVEAPLTSELVTRLADRTPNPAFIPVLKEVLKHVHNFPISQAIVETCLGEEQSEQSHAHLIRLCRQLVTQIVDKAESQEPLSLPRRPDQQPQATPAISVMPEVEKTQQAKMVDQPLDQTQPIPAAQPADSRADDNRTPPDVIAHDITPDGTQPPVGDNTGETNPKAQETSVDQTSPADAQPSHHVDNEESEHAAIEDSDDSEWSEESDDQQSGETADEGSEVTWSDDADVAEDGDFEACAIDASERPVQPKGEPEVVDAPERPEVVEISEQPEVVEISEQPEVVEATEQPEVVEAPEQPQVVEAPEQPEVVEAPEQPQVVEAPEQPQVVEAPEQPEVGTSELGIGPDAEAGVEGKPIEEPLVHQNEEVIVEECVEHIPQAVIERTGEAEYGYELGEAVGVPHDGCGGDGVIWEQTELGIEAAVSGSEDSEGSLEGCSEAAEFFSSQGDTSDGGNAGYGRPSGTTRLVTREVLCYCELEPKSSAPAVPAAEENTSAENSTSDEVEVEVSETEVRDAPSTHGIVAKECESVAKECDSVAKECDSVAVGASIPSAAPTCFRD